MTPLYIEIENASSEPLRLRYSSLSLQSDDGQAFRALAPLEVRRDVRARSDALERRQRGRRLPPQPTQYLGEIALPEACLRPGDELAGFAYFERTPPADERFTLKLELVSARSGRTFGIAQLSVTLE